METQSDSVRRIRSGAFSVKKAKMSSVERPLSTMADRAV